MFHLQLDYHSLGTGVQEQEEENESLMFLDFLTRPDFCCYCVYLDIFDRKYESKYNNYQRKVNKHQITT